MADMIKFFKGLEASLPTSGVNGALYITTDEGGIYLGTGTGMKRLGDFVQVAKVEDLPAKAHENCLYYCVAENILAKWNGTEWKQINKQPTAEEMKTLLGLGTLAYKSEVAEGDLNADLLAKVNASAEGNHSHSNKAELDKIAEGDVEKLGVAYAHSQEAHAPANAQANVIESVKVNGTALEIKDKAVDITVPTGALAGKDEVTKDDLAEALATEIDNKVVKETGKSLVADTEITKLAGVSEGANKVEASTNNGKIKIDGVETTVYTHPEKHAIADVDGLQDALDGFQAKGDYAADDHKHVKADITDFAHTHTASEITDFADAVADVKVDAAVSADSAKKVENALTVKVGGEDVVFDGSAVKTADVDAAIEAAINAIPAQTDYTVTITEATDGLDAGIAKKYTFTQNGAEIGTINLAKELVVTAGSVKEVTEADAPYAGAKVGDKYIELVIANQDAPIYVPAKDLVDIYTAKDGAAEVQVAISNTNEISATLVNGGITEEKLADGVKTKLNKVYEEVGVAKGLVDALADGQVKTNKEAIDAINDTDTGILKQAKDYADSLHADGDYAKADHDHVAADITDFATEVAKVKVDEAVKATQDGNGKVIADTYAEKATTLAGYGIADAYTKEETANQDAVVLAEAQKYADAAKAEAIAAAKSETDGQIKALAATVYTKEEVEALLAWGEF